MCLCSGSSPRSASSGGQQSCRGGGCRRPVQGLGLRARRGSAEGAHSIGSHSGGGDSGILGSVRGPGSKSFPTAEKLQGPRMEQRRKKAGCLGEGRALGGRAPSGRPGSLCRASSHRSPSRPCVFRLLTSSPPGGPHVPCLPFCSPSDTPVDGRVYGRPCWRHPRSL